MAWHEPAVGNTFATDMVNPSVSDRRRSMRSRETQRSRLIAAVIGVVEADGYSALTVGKVVTRSRISRKTFSEFFPDLEDCFLAAFEQTLARGREIALAAFTAQDGWRNGMRAALLATLAAMEQERGLARLCVIDSLGAGPRVVERREQALAEIAQAIDGGRAAATRARPMPLTADALAGGVAELLHVSLRRENNVPLTDLLGSLMSIIVLPYLGPAAARQEFDAPAPRARRAAPIVLSEGAHDLPALQEMRVTYRTVRVLSAIAQTPGASNRMVSIDAGVIDQGQISKLLSRLESLGLVENTRIVHDTRGHNAWRLTELGARVQRATRSQSP
jgi:AcrR family transcriptional regulator/DNA-binding MarR family transcriptional regulator